MNNSPSEIPREHLIDLLKSDRVSNSLLDWASRQCDREISLAMLMNQKTSQQHLESLFETFDNFIINKYGVTKNYYLNIENYEQYRDYWDVLNSIEHHINWEQKQLNNNWQEDIIYEISALKYSEFYINRNIAKFIGFNNNDLLQSYRLYDQLRWRVKKKLKFIPLAKKIITRELANGDSVSDLKQIALTSDNYKVLIQVVLNPSTNIEILEILAKDINWDVRLAVAMNYKTPLTIIEALAEDENEEVRYGILSNPNLTQEIFYRLMPDIYGHCDYSLHRLLAFLNPNISRETLEQNASSLLWNERFAIAVHPTTPEETVKKLILDGNIYVRTVASERLSSN